MEERPRSRLSRFISGVLPIGVIFLYWDANADVGGQAVTSPTARTQLNVPAGPAVETLNELALQTKITILFDSTDADGVYTAAVSGLLSVPEALARMLRGTRLTYILQGQGATVAPRELPPRPRDHPAGVIEMVTELQSVVVSVTQGRRLGDLSAGLAPIAVYTTDDIDRSGAADLPTLLRTQSQVFGGGPTESTVLGRETGANQMYGAGVNLRGLDAGAALILLDGHRLAPSGSSGAFTDISNIPLSAVRSIEVLPDGAATPYGADAPGGVVSLQMWNDFSGLQVQSRYGAVTNGALKEHRYDAIWGKSWDWGHSMFATEYYDRDSLPASDRSEVSGNFASEGGANFYTYYGNPGTIFSNGHSFAISRSQPGVAPAYARDTVNLFNVHEGSTILPGQKRVSGLGTLQFNVNSQLDGFVEALVSNRDVTARNPAVSADLTVGPENPFYVNPGGTRDQVIVTYAFGADLGPQAITGNVVTINGIGGLNGYSDGWHYEAVLDYASEDEYQLIGGLVDFGALQTALAQSDPLKAFNPFGVGSHTNSRVLDSIRASREFIAHSYYYGTHIALDGALARSPAGDVKLRAGVEYRRQTLTEATQQTAPLMEEYETGGRSVRSAFAQLWLPLLNPDQHIAEAQRLEVSAALRFDDYSDVGHGVAPSYGINWSPVPQISFRGTFSRSVRPPTPMDRVELNNLSFLVGLPDGSGITPTLVLYGNNARLASESARSWTAGVTLNPVAAIDSSVALTFFDIHALNRIDRADFSYAALEDSFFHERVTRNPTAAQVEAGCARSVYQQRSGADCTATAVGAIVDLRLRNTAALTTRGVDLLAKTQVPLGRGKVGFELTGTYLLGYTLTPAPGLSPTSLLNRPHQPIDLRLRGCGFWKYRNLQLSSVVAYANHYRDWTDSRNIASWTTVDLTASYTIVPAGSSALSDITVAFAAQNAFDRAPPFVNNEAVQVGYDQENSGVLGRLLSVSLRMRW